MAGSPSDLGNRTIAESSLTLEDIADIIGDGIKEAKAPLLARIAELEERLAQLEQSGARFRGVHQRASSYKRGDQVTAKNSLWTALTDVPEGALPGENPALWQLSVKGIGL